MTSSRTRRTAAHYALAVAAVSVGTLARQMLDPALGDHVPFATYFAAIILVAWFTRLGPSVLALMLGAWAANFFFTQPRYAWKFHLGGAAETIGFTLYAIVGITAIFACEALRRAQRRAADLAERLRIKLASIGDGVIATDTEGRITSMNPVAESLTGWTTAEAMGQPLDVVFRIVNESTRQTVENPVTKALKHGIIVGLANHTILITKDGTERFIDDSAAPIRSKDGEIVGCVLVFRDIFERKQAEQALRASAERMGLATEATGVGIWEWNLKANTIRWDAQMFRIYGVAPTKDEFVPYSAWSGAVAPEDLAGQEAILQDTVRRLGHSTREFRVLRANDGELRHIAAVETVRTDAQGQAEWVVGTNLDITERRQAQDSLLRQKTLLEALAESVVDGILIVSPDGRMIHQNQTFIDIWKFPPEVIERRSDAAALEWAAGQTADPAAFLARVAGIYDRPDAEVRDELLMRDGRVYERCGSPIRSGDARLGWVWTFRDITERQRAVNMLRRSEQELSDFFEHATVGLHWVGPDGIIIRANRAELDLLGYTRDEYIGHHIAEFHADQPVIDEILRRLTDREEVHEYPARMRCKDGSVRDVLISSNVLWEDGRFVHSRCFTRDVTERKESERQLQEGQEQLDFALAAADLGHWSLNLADHTARRSFRHDQIFGYDALLPEWTYEMFLEHVVPAERAAVDAAFQKSVASGSTLVVECRIRRADGVMRHIWTKALIRRNAEGQVERMLGIVGDITDRRQAEERQAFLVRLADTLRPLSDPIAVQAEASRLLGEHLQANRVLYFEVQGDEYVVERDYTTGVPPIAGRFPVAAFGRDLLARLLEGRTVIEADATTEPDRPPGERAAFEAIQVRGQVGVPLVKEGRFVAGMAVHASDRREWTQQEVALIEETAERTWGTIERVRAETARNESEARYRAVVEGQSEMVCRFHVDGTILFANGAYARAVGTTTEALEGSVFWNLIPSADRPNVKAILDRLTPDAPEIRIENRFVTKGGERWMLWTNRGLKFDDKGRLVEAQSAGIDITDRKNAEAALRESEERFRLVADAAPVLIWLSGTDKLCYWFNQPWLAFTGRSMDQEVGNGWAEGVHPDDFDRCLQTYIAAFDARTPFSMEYRLRRHDGEFRWLICKGVPRYRADGEFDGYIGSCIDIHDQKRAEAKLRVSEQRFREMANAAPAMIWVTNEKHECTFLSQSWLDFTGKRNAEGIGLGWLNAVHPEDRESAQVIFFSAAEKLESFELDYRLQTADGNYRWAIDAGKPRFNEVGEFCGFVGSVIDDHERHEFQLALNKAVKAAESANESKSAFLANMSHEIRTPMTAILGYADLLKDLVHQDDAIQHLQTIRNNGYYLLDIINDILDLSKIEAGKLDVACERFEPHRLIEDVRSIMEVRAKESGLMLEVQYEGKLPKVIQSDAKRLKQILINLVGNAIKFTHYGKVQIRIQFDVTTERLQFDVIDTGIGISTEQMERLFKPFSQGDASVNRNFGGTGLGLIISQRLAEMLNGAITVSSTEGIGSKFSVSIATGENAELNLVDYGTTPASSGMQPQTHDDEPTKLSCNVLVVDDRRDIRYLSKYILTNSGATVKECEDGLIAVDHVSACLKDGTGPDLILLDMQMPNLDGYATAQRLRSIGYTGPIIALTADAMQSDMNKCLEAGCNDYLSKPIDKAQLLTKVAELTHGKTP